MKMSGANGSGEVELDGRRVLVLLNGARDQRPFYTRLGNELARYGARVHFALDSHVTDYAEPGPALASDRVHCFSEYFRSHYGREDLPTILRGQPTGRILAPDVDRWRHSRFSRRSDPRYVHTLTACLAHFFEDLFSTFHFDLVLYENVSNAFAFMAFEIGKRHGARYMGFVSSRLPGRTDIVFGNQSGVAHIERTFARLRRGELVPNAEVSGWVRTYLDTLAKPDYVRGPLSRGVIEKYVTRGALHRAAVTVQYGLAEPEDAYHAFQLTNPLTAHAEHLVGELRRAARKPLLRHYFYGAAPSGPYALYPTQFHPESATSVDAVGYEDELTNIRMLALQMPHGMRLVVRDHPLASGRQPLSFYEQVRRFPNVDLTGPDLPYEPLLRNAVAVVCASSSVGYDALLRGKPTFVLGRPFYSFVPGCTTLLGFDEVHDSLVNARNVHVNAIDVRHFVTAYYMESVSSLFDLDVQRFRPGAEAVAMAAIAKHFGARASQRAPHATAVKN